MDLSFERANPSMNKFIYLIFSPEMAEKEEYHLAVLGKISSNYFFLIFFFIG